MWRRIDPGTRYFSGLFSPGCGEPVRSLRHRNLEPCTFARSTVLGDRDAGDTKDLAGEEQPGLGTRTEVTEMEPGLYCNPVCRFFKSYDILM